jgi:GntR family carbon starvation induced transcriptional regulator
MYRYAMGRSPQGRTLVEELYRTLKDDICLGRRVSGERLNLGEIQAARGVSLTVVREAVTRLVSERLVQVVPQVGFTVWPLSISDLLDITRVRIEIEALALRESVNVGDLSWEADLVAAHHRLAGAVRRGGELGTGPNYDWMRAHSEFHAALAAACTSPLLKQIRQQLSDSSELYRHWSALRPYRKKRGIAAEHSSILDAALAHDADEVVERVSSHISGTTDMLLAGRQDGATSLTGDSSAQTRTEIDF